MALGRPWTNFWPLVTMQRNGQATALGCQPSPRTRPRDCKSGGRRVGVYAVRWGARVMKLVPGQKIWGLKHQAEDEARKRAKEAEDEAHERAEEQRSQRVRQLMSHPDYQTHIDAAGR